MEMDWWIGRSEDLWMKQEYIQCMYIYIYNEDRIHSVNAEMHANIGVVEEIHRHT